MRSGALAALAGRLLSGWAVDRLGTRGFLLAGALAWAFTAPLMAGWPTTGGLLALGLLQGFGLALFTNSSIDNLRRPGRAKNFAGQQESGRGARTGATTGF